ncbi:hypothetical protein TELCIR_02347 [Teladorsagia circumcincta]|uniref:Glycosyltransferase family 92 protein n=1 Tax=Teladorsagia circumcincta TaxID=45464 RepID=A0A2G9UZN1_TELCI|nr:hypothetical protein TELCIR_02347 [Teladorsagia circumcincta]
MTHQQKAFTDWTKIIFFLETWRAHGASHIFMYYHSSTQNVRQVLRHYEREGFVTVINWPLLPRSANIDPNLSVYRLAHSLAHNDCVQRIDSEFGALVDIDELIVPSPPLTGKTFEFEALDFSGILNASETINFNGPPKVSPTEAVLLHNRYTNQSRRNSTTVTLFPFETSIDNVREAMITQTRKIFPSGADFKFETQQRLGICLQRIWASTISVDDVPEISNLWHHEVTFFFTHTKTILLDLAE